MLFSYNWLKEYIGKLPKPDKLAELLIMHSFEVEGIEKRGDDYALDIDILPNRAPDCLSHKGIARECGVLLDSKIKSQEFKLKEDKSKRAKDFIKVSVRDNNDCFRYTARVINDLKIGPSPKWIQKKLEVCGLRPINIIVDIVNCVMLETGQPLHAFDLEKIYGGTKTKEIIVRRAKKGEKIISLDDKKYTLDEKVVVIADSKEALAIAGIKGGKKAEVDNKTKTIVLESANFNYKVIRKASKSISLRTDASWRFENKIDPNLTKEAIDRAAYLIQELTNGNVVSGVVDVYPKKAIPKKVILDLDYMFSLLGVKVQIKEIKRIFSQLGFKVIKQVGQIWTVEIPTFRLDIALPEDLIEEIGRIYGYENIPAKFPLVSLIPPKRNLSVFWENLVKNILKEAGFSEMYNYSFVNKKEIESFGYKKEALEVENPVTQEQQYLRPSLIPNLLKNVCSNLKSRNEIKIFELGRIFKKGREKMMLTGLITGDSFYQMKGVIDLVLNKLGNSNIWYDEYQPTPEDGKLLVWHISKCAEIKVDSQEIGFFGEVSGKVLETMKIKEKIVLFNIDLQKLIKLCSEEHQYMPISKYPSAVRDLAILVPSNIKVEEVMHKISITGGILVRDIDLFDIYDGGELPQGKKNLAFHIIYQSEEKTLKAEEIDELQQAIIKVLEEDPEWEVRK